MIAIRPWDKLQNMLVPLSEQEKKALAVSIGKHGVLDPVLVLPDGRIIDGTHRWEICRQISKEPPYTTLHLDDETALALGVTINIARRQMSPEQIRELQKRLKQDREHQKRVALALRQAGKSQEEAAAVVGVSQKTVDNWEQPHDFYCSLLASKLKGQRGVQLQSGRPDIVTNEQVIEVEPITTWKHGLGQVLVYAQETHKQPTLALFGTEPSSKTMEVVEKSVEAAGVELLLYLRSRADPLPGKLIKAWLDDGEELTETQKRILRECGFDIDYKLSRFTNLIIAPSRVSVPKSEYQTIYERVKAGEAQSQVAADYKLSQPRVSQIVRLVKKQNQSSQRRRELAEEGTELVPPEGIRIETGDFQELGENIPPDSIDLIFTDPSYGEEYLGLWEPLAELAAKVLKPGRFLLAYCGKLYLPSILAELGGHLEYYWMAGKYYDQGHSFFRSKKIWDQWRPILIYQKPGPTEHEWFLDMIRMGSREETKELHDYGQSLEDAKYYIQKLTISGEVVLDVCCGSGTILVAAKGLGRRAIGFDVDESLTRIAKARLAENTDEAAKVS